MAGTTGHVAVVLFNPRLNLVSVVRDSVLGQKFLPNNIYVINLPDILEVKSKYFIINN